MNKYVLLFVVVACTTLIACSPSMRIPPILIASGEMVYPSDAEKDGIEGSVTLSYDVDTNGIAKNIVVVEARPPGIFDDAAIAYLNTWRFQPEKFKGEPAVSKNRHSTIGFSLENADPSYAPYIRKD